MPSARTSPDVSDFFVEGQDGVVQKYDCRGRSCRGARLDATGNVLLTTTTTKERRRDLAWGGRLEVDARLTQTLTTNLAQRPS